MGQQVEHRSWLAEHAPRHTAVASMTSLPGQGRHTFPIKGHFRL